MFSFFFFVVLCLWRQIGVAFYEMLLNADQYSSHLNYMDPICDFLYHMKYMFTGDSVKDQVSKSVIFPYRKLTFLGMIFICSSKTKSLILAQSLCMQTGELVHFYAVTIFSCSRLSISDLWVIFCSVKLKMQLEGS